MEFGAIADDIFLLSGDMSTCHLTQGMGEFLENKRRILGNTFVCHMIDSSSLCYSESATNNLELVLEASTILSYSPTRYSYAKQWAGKLTVKMSDG